MGDEKRADEVLVCEICGEEIRESAVCYACYDHADYERHHYEGETHKLRREKEELEDEVYRLRSEIEDLKYRLWRLEHPEYSRLR